MSFFILESIKKNDKERLVEMMEHPIENLMKTAMTNLKEMVDVNTIVGSPVSTADGHVVLTVSKVAFGFGAGGSDFKGEVSRREQQHTHAGQGSQKEMKQEYPFGGGSGAGVSINPVAFLVVGSSGVQVLHLQSGTHLIEKALNTVPSTVDKLVNGR
ncbi:GerW family sporulation protein [Bacillus cytotoxicus]|nr:MULTISPECIES: GerW family sporulation protein [Bacillus cereus group]AWC30799.1 sporulation protein YtfJ [Bacillus cytotoxicus]AWC34858.1 sporulation protein YtfJ [Bacillus cytotoxicus]AWC38856.1 sporulation protein YtfJ [Bacillus cytotoxicus]AWC42954.1 sporulation protein YtfJ [Bacillus cytotoxicus]AWC46840.1 sporulation protein YtfJ [Bacillus cytotoxicus]